MGHVILLNTVTKINKINSRFYITILLDIIHFYTFYTKVSNRFAALEDLDTKVEINSACEAIRENITISGKESLCYYELKLKKKVNSMV
jgi:hypothetical protein